VGINSFIFHMTGTWLGEFLDVSSMYLISGLFITFNLKRLFNLSNNRLILFYLFYNMICISLLWMIPEIGVPLFVVQVVVAGTLETRLYRSFSRDVDYKNLFRFLGAFAIAFTCWTLDITKTVCIPQNHFITGHAVWHLFNAITLYYYFRFHQQFSDDTDNSVHRV
jgi:hypothetical protein